MSQDLKLNLRRSNERGHVQLDWLNTYHTFSFGDYYDPKHKRYRSMRVLNEDFIKPSQGFGMHPHEDMEIITYMLKGSLRHEDNMGNKGVIEAGDVQFMRAGKGVIHSEYNASETEEAHLFQIWIIPENKGSAPGYEQIKIKEQQKKNSFKLIASGDKTAGSIHIDRDIQIFASILDENGRLEYELAKNRFLWLQLAFGEINIGRETLRAGDACSLEGPGTLTLEANKQAEFLLFNLG